VGEAGEIDEEMGADRAPEAHCSQYARYERTLGSVDKGSLLVMYEVRARER
jgi:hypothetical protein